MSSLPTDSGYDRRVAADLPRPRRFYEIRCDKFGPRARKSGRGVSLFTLVGYPLRRGNAAGPCGVEASLLSIGPRERGREKRA
jgi:hypothetical protein